MKVFHIDQFKCTLCSNWFCPPFNLPYLLKCSHSICTNCLKKSVENKTNQIICPQDFGKNKISDIQINQSTKRALERLLKEHNNFTKTTDLECIKNLSMNFDEMLDSKQIQLKNLSALIDQIFQNELKRLKQIYSKIKIEINKPFRIVNDWKQVVKSYLNKIKQNGMNSKGVINQLNHYIEEGRKIKLDLNDYLKYNFKSLIDCLLVQPQVCFTHNFTIFNDYEAKSTKDNKANQQLDSNHNNTFTLSKPCLNNIQNKLLKKPHSSYNPKNFNNEKQIQLRDITNNFDQSSICMRRHNNYDQGHSHSIHLNNKLSLYEELMQDTSKVSKIAGQNNINSKVKYIGQLTNANVNMQRVKQNNIINNNNNKKILNRESARRSTCSIYPFEVEDSPPQNVSSLKEIQIQNSPIQNCELDEQYSDYNSLIKSKIKQLKQQTQSKIIINKNHLLNNEYPNISTTIKPSLLKQQQQKRNSQTNNKTNKSNKTNSKMGQSLEYSPEMNENQWDRYSMLDNYDFVQNQYENCYEKNQKYDKKSLIKPIKVPLLSPSKSQYQEADSLQSYYQQSTTLNNPKNSKPIKSKQQPQQQQLQLQQSEQQQQDFLLDPQSSRHHKSPAHPKSMNNNWQLQNINFLKQWKIQKQQKQQQPLQVIQKYGGYDCEKQKDRYVKKIEENRVRELIQQTNLGDNYIQLVGNSLNDCNIALFLNQIDWSYRNIEIIKFIRTNMNDQQMNQLLNYLVHTNVHTLMLSYNNLTELSLDALLNFVEINKKLKNIYVPKNNISQLKGNARVKINLLKEKGINMYI